MMVLHSGPNNQTRPQMGFGNQQKIVFLNYNTIAGWRFNYLYNRELPKQHAMTYYIVHITEQSLYDGMFSLHESMYIMH